VELNLMYVHGPQIGYGRYGTFLASELKKKGVQIFDDLPSPEAARPPGWADGHTIGRSNVICWVSTPAHAGGWWKGQTPILSTMWEASELPASFTENLHEFETIIVPSRQNEELFGNFHSNVRFLPLGVDPEVWYYQPRRESKFFDFLIGGSGARKGGDLAQEAFIRVFGDASWDEADPIPRLILKSPRGEEELRHRRVSMVAGRLSPEDEVGLYSAAHCYLQPSRGEGFGLQPLQAIAQGLPTILTAAHGHDSFAHLGYGLDSKPKKAAYFIYGDAGNWWEPDLDQLCQQMEYVYTHYTDACAFAKRSAEIVADQFTWERCAEGFLNIVGRDNLTEYQGPDDWYTPTLLKYRVVTNQDHFLDGATAHMYQRGEEYWETADIKRILFDAGKLDPVCLSDFDTGLHPSQLLKLEEYKSQHAYCPTCHQRLNSQPTKSDDIYNGVIE
jgi:glycosyltransferase involved in cell wall biosynthesis